MYFRQVVFALIIVALGSLAFAQPPAVSDPAYRHFLNSPYSYKAFSALRPGYAETRVTPFGWGSSYVEPWRLHQRITPFGFESHEFVPGHGGTSADPWMFQTYRAPGYTQGYYLPPPVIVVPRR
jgi:hypothetical protein